MKIALSFFFLVISFVSVSWADYGETVFASKFGGSGNDNVRAVAFTSEGKLLVGGISTDVSSGIFSGSQEAFPGSGFIALIDLNGRLEWVRRFCPVVADGFRTPNPDVDIYLVCCEQLILKIQLEDTGPTILNETNSDGSARVKFDIIPKGNGDFDVVYLSESRWLHVYDRNLVKLGPGLRVERDHVQALGVDYRTRFIYVGGDENTNTGYEPYRSPFAWRYTYTPTEITRDTNWQLYNYPGNQVRDCGGSCADRNLQSDSFFREFQYLNATMWFVAGSDGGNTVFRREPNNLDQVSNFQSGACYSGPCFGYKGAKNPHFFGALRGDYSGFQRGSWIVPYLDLDQCSNCANIGRAEPCKCLSTPGGPNSIRMRQIFLHGDEVIVLSDSFARPPESLNAWYYDAHYDGSGQTHIAIFDSTLSTIRMGTMLPNTNAPQSGAYRNGMLAVVGQSKAANAPTSQTPEGNPWTYSFPEENAIQSGHGGGDTDGFIFVRCLSDTGRCGIKSSDIPDGDPNPGNTGNPGGDFSNPDDNSGVNSLHIGFILHAIIAMVYILFLQDSGI